MAEKYIQINHGKRVIRVRVIKVLLVIGYMYIFGETGHPAFLTIEADPPNIDKTSVEHSQKLNNQTWKIPSQLTISTLQTAFLNIFPRKKGFDI